MPLLFKVGARASKLSRAQVQEIATLFPHVTFVPTWVATTGDKDLKASLRTLDKTDFFTKEIEERQLQGDFRISIHSAKDLPSDLRKGLKVVAITAGVDPSDALIFNSPEIPKGARIGTSSERRDIMLKQWRPDLQCIDIRGSIEERLRLLDEGALDGVVIAEAALIRLKLTHRKRIKLLGPTAPLQGKLAIVARADDLEMEELFAPIDTRKRLYLGTEALEDAFHFPIIKLIPRPIPTYILEDMDEFTHVIFTSKNAVSIFCEAVKITNKIIVAIGKKTAEALTSRKIEVHLAPEEESQEGLIELLRPFDLDDAYILYPRSSGARGVLEDFFRKREIRYQVCDLYDTMTAPVNPGFDLHEFKEIIFTSPSTVRAFREIFGSIPADKKLTCQGKITQAAVGS